jgi:hypothetical protein
MDALGLADIPDFRVGFKGRVALLRRRDNGDCAAPA